MSAVPLGSDADSGAHTLSFASPDHDSCFNSTSTTGSVQPGAVRVHPVVGTEVRLSKGGQGPSDDTIISLTPDEVATVQQLVEATLVDEDDTRVALRRQNQALRQILQMFQNKTTPPNGHHQEVPKVVKNKRDNISFTSSMTMSVFSTRDARGDRGIYSGVVVHTTGMPHGVGRMVYADGRIYDGDWCVFSYIVSCVCD
jgi:hypothetical protein